MLSIYMLGCSSSRVDDQVGVVLSNFIAVPGDGAGLMLACLGLMVKLEVECSKY